jgi:transcription factor C subunit 3
MAMRKTTMFYVHYAGHNFAKLVEAGQASWEAVEFPEKKAKSLKIEIPPFNVVAQLDEYGFPRKAPPKSLLKNPNATIMDGIAYANPSDYLLSSSDPFVVRLPDGRHGTSFPERHRVLGTHGYIWLTMSRSCTYPSRQASSWI